MPTKQSPSAPKLVVRESHRKGAAAFLDAVATPFRRADLSNQLYPLTTPRSRATADRLADTLIRDMAKAGKILRHGHLHWVKVSKVRTLLGGRIVPEMPEPVTLPITTSCPGKWVSVDLESGEIWAGSAKGWRRATLAEQQEASALLPPM